MSLSFFLKISDNYSRIWFIITFVIVAVLVVALGLTVFLLLRRLRSSGVNLKSVLLVSCGGTTTSQLSSGASLSESGFKITERLEYVAGEDWLGRLADVVAEKGVHEVWLCLPLSEGGVIQSILYALRHHTVAVRFIPEWGDTRPLNHRVSHIAGLYSLDLSCTSFDGPACVLKRLEDLLIGGVISISIVLVCLLIALTINVRLLGRCFSSNIGWALMVACSRCTNSARWSSTGKGCCYPGVEKRCPHYASRAFLRKTSLDELPQFFQCAARASIHCRAAPACVGAQ